MRRSSRSIRTLWLALCASLSLTGLAHAQTLQLQTWEWTAWSNIGETAYWGVPHCAAAPNRIHCLAMHQDGSTWQSSWSGNQWTAWTAVGSFPQVGAPSCVYDSVAVTFCFLFSGTDTNNGVALTRAWVGDTAAGAWQPIDGRISSPPECHVTTPGAIDCYARGVNGRLRRARFDGATWSAWAQPNAGVEGPEILGGGGPFCAARGPNNQAMCLYDLTHDIGVFDAATGQFSTMVMPSGATNVTTPFCHAQGADIACFAGLNTSAPGFDLGMWRSDGGSGWSFVNLGNYVQTISHADGSTSTNGPIALDCTLRSGGRVDCMALHRGDQQNVYLRHRVWRPPTNPEWLESPRQRRDGWNDVAGAAPMATSPGTQSLDCFSLDGEAVDCFAGGGSNPIWRTRLVATPGLSGRRFN